FDTIPHSDLLKSVARRIVDRHVLHLIKMWLQAPVEERDGDGKRRISEARHASGRRRQSLAGQHLHEPFSEALAAQRMRRSLSRAVVSYADDFVILSRGFAAEALAWTRAVMTKLGLTLNEAKTSVKDARREGFDFLGYYGDTSVITMLKASESWPVGLRGEPRLATSLPRPRIAAGERREPVEKRRRTQRPAGRLGGAQRRDEGRVRLLGDQVGEAPGLR
ncbi:MAG TPA: reverse transcriptase domain-containing protein, partial [Candidatus Acidoferrales bacterium]|nr:reverse transcriptase domain-containing protein [Candidatus Acidoferrales bacterium]